MADIKFNIGLINDEAVASSISTDAKVSDLRREALSYFNLNESDVSVEGDSLMLINVTREQVLGNGNIGKWVEEGDEVRVIPEQYAGIKVRGHPMV
jgi:hypothetical protein